jgi:hypothetical protein
VAKKVKKGKKKSKKATRKPTKKPARTPVKAAARKTSRKAPKKRARPPIPTLRTPPSSLDMDRQPSAARSGRRALQENQKQHNKMAAVTGGDVDADMESAYFTGDEAPGGDNPTPDQNDVDEIGHAIGVEYNDNQELRGGEEVVDRDKNRWKNE